MSLKAKIEAVIYAAEEPVTLLQLVSLLGVEAQAELEAAGALQGQLDLLEAEPIVLIESEPGDQDALNAETLGPGSSAAEEAVAALNADADAFLESRRPPAETQSVNPVPEEAEAAGEANADATDVEEVSASEIGPNAGAAALAAEPTTATLRARERRLREYVRSVLDLLIAEYAGGDRGLEIREIAGGFRFGTKPEYHDAVRGFIRSLKPPLKLSLQALETLAVVAYKQPVTAPEVAEIRGVDTGGVLGSLMARKLVTTAGRKQVIGRPILYKTTKEFLLRFGLKDLAELPSIEEFERLASNLNEAVQEEIPMPETTVVPVGTVLEGEPLSPAEVARELEPSRGLHSAQADGDPNPSTPSPDEVDAENLTPAADGPGEFTGNESAPPVDNASIDGRLSGLPPNYENADNPSAHDADVQAEQPGNAGEDH